MIATVAILLLLVLCGCGENPKNEAHKLLIECVGNNDEENKIVTVTDINNFTFPEIKKEGHQLVMWCIDEELSEEFDIESVADAENGFVTLSTIHSAKGLEFPVVFIAGMEEGIFPHSRAISFASTKSDTPAFINNEIYYKELNVYGSYSPSPDDITTSFNLLKNYSYIIRYSCIIEAI